ncbi:MAG: N-methylhydantoinase [Actinomycetota bacterium]|nr:N-methylhydantoinase [Actinomycetota bacterium]
MAVMTTRIRIGIDTGGTFTDVVALDESTGDLVTTKTPSTPSNPADGFMAGVGKVLELLGGEPRVVSVSHGTTVATNQLLEGKVGDLGFITTEGYEFLLEIARQSVPDGYGNSYFWVKPPRIVPLHRVRTVGGRLDYQGREVRPFDEAGAVAVARWFREAGIDTIGVCFLHSYADPGHEQAMREVLRREHPAAVVSISSEVLREYREYERAVTTLVDAAVKPRMASYVANIAGRLRDLAQPGDDRVPFYVMKSNGGVLSAEEVVHQPITTVLSGPAAGALGAALVAREAGFDRLLTCDGGGTSTDVSVVLAGEPTLTTEGTVGSYPSKIPMIDVVTVGAGGGSVAWVTPEGSLKVGPRSAGADPGPLCYARGGTEPTVTDAHVLLGRIPPHLLGGEIPLDVAAARAGLEALGSRLGLPVEQAAAGILEISAWNQANALREVTVKRGLDVRDFTMATFGGSGSLLLCRLLDVLGLAGVLVPRDPGNLSAFGLLTVDVRNDYVRTAVSRHTDLDHDLVAGVLDDLQGQAAAALDREGFARAEHRYLRSADLRYVGQAFEVRVPVPDGAVDDALAEKVADSFHDAHEQLYGYAFRGDPRQPVEWVNLRVTGVGPIDRPRLRELAPRDGGPDRARTGVRPVFFDDWVDTPVYWRADLAPGDVVVGPAIIEEFGSTVPLHPGFTATVDRFGNLLVRKAS